MIKPKTIAALNYPDLGIASDWSFREESLLQPITSTTQIWVVTRHQYGTFCACCWRRERPAVLLATVDNVSGAEGSLKGLKKSWVDVGLYNH